MVIPGPPERDWAIHDACLRARGWEYREDEPRPVPATPSDPGPAATATGGGPWRLVVGGVGVELLPNQAACARRQRELRETSPSAYCIKLH